MNSIYCDIDVSQIVQTVSNYRFDLSCEKRLQSDFAVALQAEGIPYTREVTLGELGIVDFMVGKIAIECKLRGQRKMSIYRQLARYAEHPDVELLVLVTNISMGLPQSINGKPAFYVSLSHSWM